MMALAWLRWLLAALLLLLLALRLRGVLWPHHQQLLPPVVVVPGYATSQLEAQLTHLYRPSSPRCGEQQGKGWFRLYLNQTALKHDRAGVRCFAQQMTTVYDRLSGDYYNLPGVETNVPSFGSVAGLRFPDPDDTSFSYMDAFLLQLELAGYRDGETLFGAPYDFRYAVAPPHHRSSVGAAYFRRLKRLVEKATRRSGGAPVTVVAHSLGGPLAYHFLLRQSLPWRRQFVRRFVPVAAPWGGVVSVMYALVYGNGLGLPGVDPMALRGEYRSLQSTLWLLPTPRVFGDGDGAAPLVTTRRRNYTASVGGMGAFLADAGIREAVEPYETRVVPMFRELPSPRVPVACVVGVGVDTLERMVYAGDLVDDREMPAMVMGDGDGLVNLASLVAVDPAWRRPGAYFSMHKVRKVLHTDMLRDERAIDVVIRAIMRPADRDSV